MNKIILASQSPRRKQLLEWAEIPFEVFVKETSEDYPPGLEPEEVAVYIAQQKAAVVQKLVSPGQAILAADTIVVLGENIIGKPVHREEAVSILFALSGENHNVITGVALREGETVISCAVVRAVVFDILTR